MTSSRRKYLKEARQRRMRDLTYSPYGFLALFFSLAAIALFVVAVTGSYMNHGEGSYAVGAMGMVGLVLAVGGFLLGRWSLKIKKIRPLPSKVGVVIGLILIIVYIVFFILGVN